MLPLAALAAAFRASSAVAGTSGRAASAAAALGCGGAQHQQRAAYSQQVLQSGSDASDRVYNHYDVNTERGD